MSLNPRRISPAVVLASFVALLLAVPAFAQSASSRTVPNTQTLGPEDASKQITVTVWLKTHNQAAFDKLVREMYQPGSATYHHFLTREQYHSQFAPTAAEAAQVSAYLLAHNFTVTSVDKDNPLRGRPREASETHRARLTSVESRQSERCDASRQQRWLASIPGAIGQLVNTVQGLSDFTPRNTLTRAIDPATGQQVAAKPISSSDLSGAVASNICLNGVQTENFTTNGGYPKATYTGYRYQPMRPTLVRVHPRAIADGLRIESSIQQGFKWSRSNDNHRRRLWFIIHPRRREYIFVCLWLTPSQLNELQDLPSGGAAVCGAACGSWPTGNHARCRMGSRHGSRRKHRAGSGSRRELAGHRGILGD